MNKAGYWTVALYKNCKSKYYRVHRLVAFAFIPGDFSLQVNHIDGNKGNNIVSNLEWATARENKIHAIRTGLIDLNDHAELMKQLHAKEVVKIGVDGDVLAEYDSTTEAAKDNNVHRTTVSKQCIFYRKSKHADYYFRYKNAEEGAC